ncbi:MAG: DHHW family protein [Bacillota bacterium]|nr:DHHW family protein [Bacillota bacterium]
MKYNEQVLKVIAAVFMIYLSSIAFLYLMIPDNRFSESENRMLEQMPRFSMDDLWEGKLSSDCEKYLTDQFPFRDFWIGVKSDSERILGRRENNGVYLGEDGRLFQKCNEMDKKGLQATLATINSFAVSRADLDLYFLLVPNSAAIYKDSLPAYAPTDNSIVYINQIKSSLDNQINYIDIYDSLLDQKGESIYYKTDHHWTTIGAYCAYRHAAKSMGFAAREQDDFQIKKVTDSFYGSLYSKGGFRHLNPDKIELYIPKSSELYTVDYYDYNQCSNSLYFMDNLKKKDKYSVFLNGNQSLIRIRMNTDNDKKLLLLKDSFANSFVPFLTEHYSEIYVVNLRYYNDNLSQLIDSQGINNVLLLYSVNGFLEKAGEQFPGL